jgi:hypothetical protein
MTKTKQARPKKRTKRSSASRGAPTPDVLVKVDAKLKALYDRSLHAIDDATARGMSAFDERWEAADAILSHNPPLYVVGGFKDAREFFREVMHEEERTAFRWVRVARYASPREEELFGPTLLDAAISYMEAKYGPVEDALPVAFERLKLPVVRAGVERKIPLSECTVADVIAATRRLRKPKPGGRNRVADAFVESLGKVASLAGVQVRERAGLLTFANVPVAALARFVAALRSSSWDTPPAVPPALAARAPAKRRTAKVASVKNPKKSEARTSRTSRRR